MVICLDRVAALHMAQLMPLPLTSGVVVPERRSWGWNGVPVVIRPPRRNAIAAAFRQMFAVKIRFAYSEIRPCLM